MSDKAYDAFSRVASKALDYISCIIFKTLLGNILHYALCEYFVADLLSHLFVGSIPIEEIRAAEKVFLCVFSWYCFTSYCIFFVLYYFVLYCIVLYCVILYCIVLYCVIVLYCIVLCCVILHCIVLHCIVLQCIVLYCIVLYCGVLYRIVLYCIVPSKCSNPSQRYLARMRFCSKRVWLFYFFQLSQRLIFNPPKN